MTEDVGKREAHKIATRQAIQTAADSLFDAKGYADTTVRDIADAAGVTERTFFRYFSGKEALLVQDIVTRLPILTGAIRRRPAGEAPLEAVENAVLALGRQRRDARPNLSWLFDDGPPGPKLEKSMPGLLLMFEQEVADALADRLGGHRAGSPDTQFRSEVLARCAVGALRSAGIRHSQLRNAGVADSPSLSELVKEAFAILHAL
ncbi:TetR family transcriptional regulator [soil metagenome]